MTSAAPAGSSAHAKHGVARSTCERVRAFAVGTAVAGLALCAAGALAADETASGSAPASCPQPFKVTFNVEWHGLGAGTSTLQLTRKSPTEYIYTSSNVARGLFRLAIPDTITQISHFFIVDGKVRPSSYVGDDGSTDTARDVSLNFDWANNRVTGTAEDKPVNQPITPGVQDSLSVQAALMCALAAGLAPSLGYLPVRAEQLRKGKRELQLTLQSVERG